MKIRFEHNSRSTPSVTAVEKISRVDKVVSNVPFKHKTGLIVTDKRRNERLEAPSEHFRNTLDGAILKQMMDLGVEKVLVSTLPPIGCTPWLSRSSDYSSSCDSHKVASIHNAYLEEKVFKDAAVFNLDLKTMFKRLTSGSGSLSKKFKHKLEPCCEIFDQSEYCGQMEDGVAAYSLCSTPDKYFYWDDINPTHAGWKAVVKELEESIKNFL
jgi:phospholipase/lecithinase/hemolysin